MQFLDLQDRGTPIHIIHPLFVGVHVHGSVIHVSLRLNLCGEQQLEHIKGKKQNAARFPAKVHGLIGEGPQQVGQLLLRTVQKLRAPYIQYLC